MQVKISQEGFLKPRCVVPVGHTKVIFPEKPFPFPPKLVVYPCAMP